MLDFMKDILPMLFSLLAVVVVLYLSYATSKFLAKRVSKNSDSRSIRVVERASLGQDKGLAIAEICKVYYLISFCENRIEILKELPDYTEAGQAEGGDFQTIFLQNLKDRFGVGDKNKK